MPQATAIAAAPPPPGQLAASDSPPLSPAPATRRHQAPVASDRLSRRMRLLLRKGFFRPSALGLQVGRATTPEDLEEAYRLVHTTYVRCGYIQPRRCGLRVRAHEATLDTATFIAKVAGKLAGLTSVILDSPDLGLPADEVFGEALDGLRREGRKVCEGSNWVLTPPHRGSPVMTELLRCCLAHVMTMGCDDFVGAVSPGHVSFYQLLGFEAIGPVRSYSRDVDDPVVLVRLRVDQLGQRLARADVEAEAPDDEAVVMGYYVADNPYLAHIEPWENAARKRFRDVALLRELFLDKADLPAQCHARQLDAIRRRWRRPAS